MRSAFCNRVPKAFSLTDSNKRSKWRHLFFLFRLIVIDPQNHPMAGTAAPAGSSSLDVGPQPIVPKFLEAFNSF